MNLIRSWIVFILLKSRSFNLGHSPFDMYSHPLSFMLLKAEFIYLYAEATFQGWASSCFGIGIYTRSTRYNFMWGQDGEDWSKELSWAVSNPFPLFDSKLNTIVCTEIKHHHRPFSLVVVLDSCNCLNYIIRVVDFKLLQTFVGTEVLRS